MNKKAITCLTMTTFAFGACALVISHTPEFRTHANGTPYVLELSDISSGYYTQTYYGIDGVWNPFLTATKNHNDVYLRTEGYSPFNRTFGTNYKNYFANISPINGLKSISVTATNDVTISYGYAPNRFDVINIPLASGDTFDFDNNYPSYFKVQNSSGLETTITGFTLEYSCEEHANPFNDNYLLYEFNGATVEENKGYIVRNSATNYGNLSGDVVIKDTYDDGENGEYPVIGTSDYIFAGSVTPCVTSVYFPDSIKSYGKYTFQSNKSLKSVRLSPNALNIAEEMFHNCENLQGVNIPNGVLTIGSEAFNECNSIESIVIPDSVVELVDGYRQGVFQGMDNLKNITWGAGLPQIKHLAGTGLETITIPDTVTSIASYAFLSCHQLRTVVMGANVANIYISAFNDCPALETVDFSRNTKLNILYTNAFRSCTSLNNVVLPDSLTQIGNSAFRECSSLENITIGSNVVYIDDYAFDSCPALKTISFPGNSINFGGNAVSHCTALTTAVFAEGNTEVENYCFEGCTALNSVTLPSTITYIGISSFGWCSSLTRIDLPAGLSKICNRAFQECTNLSTINFAGTMDQWNAVNKDTDNNWWLNISATVVHCSNGDVPIA